MRLEQLSLRNWRRYEECTIDFDGNVIGIMGPNDGGKSTIVDAISYLILGTTSRVKARNIRWGESEGQISGVISHRGHRLEITRGIKSSRSYLRIDDKEVFRKASDVKDALSSLLNISPSIFNNHIIVSQGKLDRPLLMQHAELSKDFQYLFGTEKCEALRELLHMKMSGLSLVEDGQRERARLITELTRLKKDAAEAADVLADISSSIKSLDVAGAAELVEDYQKYSQFTAARIRIENDLSKSRELLGGFRKELEPLIPRLEEAGVAIEENREFFQEATRFLAQVDANQQHLEMLTRLRDLIRTAKEEVQRLQAYVPVSITESVRKRDKLNEQKSSLSGELDALQRYLRAFSGALTDVATCPTCLQPVKDVRALVQQYSYRQKRILEEQNTISSEIQKLELFIRESEAENQRHERDRLLAEQKLNDAEEQRRQCKHVTPASAEDVRIAKETVRTFNSIQDAYGRLGHKVADLQSHVMSLEESISKGEKTLSNLTPVREIYAKDIEAARAILRQKEDLDHKRTEHETRLSLYTEGASRREAELEKLASAVNRSAAVRKYKDLLERSRHILHRDNLPRMIALGHLRGINAILSEITEMLNFPYVVEIMDDLSFLCSDRDGFSVLADELGGGRRMLFGLALRLAINRRFASDVGFLVLDEPSVYLDPDSVESMADVFENVRQYTRATGTQILVVTHEVELRRVFDTVIDVSQL